MGIPHIYRIDPGLKNIFAFYSENRKFNCKFVLLEMVSTPDINRIDGTQIKLFSYEESIDYINLEREHCYNQGNIVQWKAHLAIKTGKICLETKEKTV